MLNPDLTSAVENFASVMLPLSERDLERPYPWKGYDEGIRFTFFMTILELRELAARLAPKRETPTQVHRILAQYHAQYMDLQAAIFGLSAEASETAPAENEWPVREVYAHILGAEFGFRAVIRYALEGHRASAWTDAPTPESEYPRLYGMPEEEYRALMNSPLDRMAAYHRELHTSILAEFASITNVELDLPSTFWEETRFPIRYRLHRFEAHTLQHTVQMDKTLPAVGLAPTESKMLVRKMFAALAEVDGVMIGVGKADNAIRTFTSSLNERRMEVANILRK
jgi:hypothetical protein